MSFALAGCGSDVTQVGWSVTIAPLAGEDILGPCTYDLTLEPIGQVQQGILVLFDRADTSTLYMDKTFRNAALALHYAILFAHQCPSASSGDIQEDAAKGQGRMLFAALSQLAQVTNHPELETTGMILYGFSAAGVLTATMANDYPARMLGTIQYAAGSIYVNLDNVQVGAAGVMPTLILANADDPAAGTSRSFHYFQRGRAVGAPWAYAVQNDTQHCCTLSTRDVILPWIEAVVAANAPSVSGTKAISAGTMSYFVCTPDGVADNYGYVDCRFTTAGLGDGSVASPQSQSGWLPSQASGDAWLAWVTNPSTN